MKNKWIKCSERLPDHNQKVKYRFIDGSISSGSFDTLHLWFIPFDKINMCNCHYTLINEWKPIKLKLNKYRWREMKDEKPEIGEEIIFSYKEENKLNSVGFYEICFRTGVTILGVKKPCDLSGSISNYWSTIKLGFITDKLKWRPMCKLPGEE